MNARQLIFAAAARGLRPPDPLPIHQWAEENVVFGPLSPEPGSPYRVSRAPYVRRWLDVMSPEHPAKSLVTVTGTQLSKTTTQLLVAAYYLIQVPSSVMAVLPDKHTAQEWSDKRFADLLENSPRLAVKLSNPYDRAGRSTGENTMFSKQIANGGLLKVAWASSGMRLRSTPAKIICTDEVDGFRADVDDEGDVIRLAERRQTNFHRAKAMHSSSPKLKHSSIIWREYLAGDQEQYFVPCPACGHHQVIRFEQLVWEKGQPQTVQLKCRSCEELISERYKTQMLEQGLWVATADHPGILEEGFFAEDMERIAPILDQMAREEKVSCHLNSFYSPAGWFSWAEAAEQWERDSTDPTALKVFVNTVMAEPWEDRGAAPDEEKLYAKREFYARGVVPVGGLFLTASVDVQANPPRLECEIAAWGRDKERWSVDYITIPGEPENPDTWNELERKVLLRDWPTAYPGGHTMPIMVMAIDTGHAAHSVYDFAHRHPQPVRGPGGYRIAHPRTVACTKGAPSFDRLISNVSTEDAARKRGNITVYHIGTGYAKIYIYSRLRMARVEDGQPAPAGYWHFPDYPFDYSRQLTSESLKTSATGKRAFEKDPSKPRNEALDNAVGNLFAAGLFGIDRFTREHWDYLAQQFEGEPDQPPPPPAAGDGAAPAAARPAYPAVRGRRIIGRFS